MSAVDHIFSFLCNQDVSRSFIIDGHVLPLCQRCTGVYMGMSISFLYLLVSRYYRKGLPPRSVIYTNIASLLIMPIFGFHLLDPGAAWRLWSGLIFGNAIAFLLLPAVVIICSKGKVFGHHTKVSTSWSFVFLVFLNTIPLWFPVQSSYFYYTILILAFAGPVCVLFCAGAVMGFLIRKATALFILKGFGNECARN